MPSCSASSPTGTARPATRDGVQQPHPGRVGQAGEPLRVGRRVARRQWAVHVRREHGQGQVRAHAAQYRRASMVASIDGRRYSREPFDRRTSMEDVMGDDELPVVVIGAGPSGLAAAAHLLDRGLKPLVLEAGPSAGAAVASGITCGCSPAGGSWSTRRRRSCWPRPAGRRRTRTGTRPARSGPSDYLQPLADALGDRVRFGARVVGVARRGRDRVVDAGRDTEPLTVHVTTADGRGADHRARGDRRLRHLGAAEPAGRRTGCRRWASGPRPTASPTRCPT